MRIKKTVASGTTYFLYNGGSPVVEETYSGSAASLSAVNGEAADGWRARYDGGVVFDYAFDPQGSVVQRQTAGDYAAGAAAFDETFYEGYGALRQDYSVRAGGGVPAHHDPVGFGGQFGYYTDTETGLLCLTHRYYDPGTGKFINRDPIGYAGGQNLYGFADGNPVNEEDEDGTQGRPPTLPRPPTTAPANGQPMRVVRGVGRAVIGRLLFRSSLIAFLVLNPTPLADDSMGPIWAAEKKTAIEKSIERNKERLAEDAAWREREASREARPARPARPAPLTPEQIVIYRAAGLGYAESNVRSAKGEPMFFNSRNRTYISEDNTSHNADNAWKYFVVQNGKPVRTGTYNANLTQRLKK